MADRRKIMSKNKSKPVEPEIIEEAVETAEPDVVEADDSKFFERTLKAINKMENPAKAERLADRLLRKRKG